MKAFICINSSRSQINRERVRAAIAEAAGPGGKIIICADSGAHLTYPDILPDFIVGDLDSISPKVRKHYESAGTAFEKHPKDKDYTDFHLALDLALKYGRDVDEIVVFGGLSRRLDQTVGNIYIAACFQLKTGVAVSLHESGTHVYILSAGRGCPELLGRFARKGDTVSLRPLFESVGIASTRGLKYGLTGETLRAEESRGTSNVAAGEKIEVEVSSGALIIMHLEKKGSSRTRR